MRHSDGGPVLRAKVQAAGAFSPEPGTYSVILQGCVTVVRGESFAVADGVADAIEHPERWHGTEIGGVAESIRRRWAPLLRLPDSG